MPGQVTRRRPWSALRATLVLLAFASVHVPAQAAPTEIRIDLSSDLGPTNQRLVGFGWNTGAVDGVAPLRPHTVRIDARLESASPAPGVVELDDLRARVAAVRDIGAEPLVILSYMPGWLAQPAYGRDPTRVAPSDLDEWQALVESVVAALATAEAPATRFEVWNEPDVPVFWQDSPAAFMEMAERTHRAVAAVAARTGITLEVGGPAAFFADPLFIGGYVEAITRAGLPLDFVSWHHYGNTPFLGPDGAEDIIPEPFTAAYPLVARRNPVTTPVVYRAQVHEVRVLVEGLLAARPGYEPDLVIDEWNLSPGGYDVRHDSHVGAAFAAAVLMEMEAAGLDAADYYRAAGSDDPGDWGIVRPDGSRKPAWWVFRAWQRTGGRLLSAEGAQPAEGLFARASADGTRVHVLLASFVASGGTDRTVDVALGTGCGSAPAQVRGIDASSPAFRPGRPLTTDAQGTITVELPAESVRWLTARCASGSR